MSDKNPFDDNDGLDDLDEFNSSGDDFNEFDKFDESSDFEDLSDNEDVSPFSDQGEGGLDSEEESDSTEYETDQEEVSEEAFEPKPFLKTPIGMVSVAAGVVAVLVAGSNVAGLFNSSSPSPSQDVGFTPPPPVAQEPEFRQPFPTAAQPEQPVSGASDVADTGSIPVIHEVGTAAPSFPVEVAAPAVISEVESLKEKLETELDAISELQKQLAQTNEKLEALQKAFEKSERERVKIATAMTTMETKVAEAISSLESERKKAEELALQEEKESEIEKQEEKLKDLKRLPDLIVIDSSANGDMMIIRKVSNGRVFTLFKGERIITPFGRFSVTELDPEAGTILVGGKYFIDRDTPPAPKAPVAKPKLVVKKAKKPAEPVVSDKLTLSAIFEEGTSFGIVNKEGEFNVYKIGDNIPGVGAIHGLNSDKKLRAGNTLIKQGF